MLQRTLSRAPQAVRPLASLRRHFSVKEAGRTTGEGPRAVEAGQEAVAMDSTVEELSSTMGSRAKVPFGAGPEAGEAGPGVRIEGEVGVSRKVESVAKEGAPGGMEQDVAASAERLQGTPQGGASEVQGKGDAAAPHPLRGKGKGPRGWGAAESDSEAPPRGVTLE